MTDIRLVQFRFSHYNEKVRWALDYKGVQHHRETLLAGFHMSRLKALGARTVPVLLTNNQPLADSSAIIDDLERRYPEPSLYPEDPEARARALAWQTKLDEGLGVAGRQMFFYNCLDHIHYLATCFAGHRPWLFRKIYTLGMTYNKPVLIKKMKLSPDVYQANQKILDQAFEELDQALAGRDYLVGDRFSIADLTAASLLSPLLLPDQFPHRPKSPPPEPIAALAAEKRAKYRSASWVDEIYRKHRGQAACPPGEV